MAAAYTTMISYIVLTLLMTLWANKIYGRDKVNSVLGNKNVFVISVIGIAFMMLGLFLYRFYIIRYAIIVVITILVWRLYKKSELKIKTIDKE
jgi:lipoprotein signal peptidase